MHLKRHHQQQQRNTRPLLTEGIINMALANPHLHTTQESSKDHLFIHITYISRIQSHKARIVFHQHQFPLLPLCLPSPLYSHLPPPWSFSAYSHHLMHANAHAISSTKTLIQCTIIHLIGAYKFEKTSTYTCQV
jgi:hypothetical protein